MIYHRAPEPLKNVYRRCRARCRVAASRRLGMESHDDLLLQVIRARQIGIVIDVGAHDGEFGRNLRHIGYRGRILSFEPVSAHFARLREASSGDKDWDAFPFALGDSERSQEIHIAAIGQFSSFLETSELSEATFGEKSRVVRTETVQIQRLDDAMDEIFGKAPLPSACLLKMDTQGYDLKVLEGAGRRVGEIVALQSEVAVQSLYEGMPSDTESIGVMRGLGFEIAGVFPVTRDQNLIVMEFDYLMLRPPSGPQHG